MDETQQNSKFRLYGDREEIVQEIEIWPYNQMVYAHPNISSREWDT